MGDVSHLFQYFVPYYLLIDFRLVRTSIQIFRKVVESIHLLLVEPVEVIINNLSSLVVLKLDLPIIL